MKLEIDTEKDSSREFRAAIRLLEALLGEHAERAPSVLDSASDAPPSPGLMNMFEPAQTSAQNASQNPNSSGDYATERPESQKRPAQVWDVDEDEPRIEPY